MSRHTLALAEVPTDVLVYLVEQGDATIDELVTAVAPADADAPYEAVGRALSLLRSAGYASTSHGVRWQALDDGIAVQSARTRARGSSEPSTASNLTAGNGADEAAPRDR